MIHWFWLGRGAHEPSRGKVASLSRVWVQFLPQKIWLLGLFKNICRCYQTTFMHLDKLNPAFLTLVQANCRTTQFLWRPPYGCCDYYLYHYHWVQTRSWFSRGTLEWSPAMTKKYQRFVTNICGLFWPKPDSINYFFLLATLCKYWINWLSC